MFWVVRDGSETYLIDCGIKDEKLIAVWRIQEYSEPVTLLEKLNIGTKDIAGIIITHLHPDHFDGAFFFPDSTFFTKRCVFCHRKSVQKNDSQILLQWV